MINNLRTEDGIFLSKGSDVSMLTFSIQSDGEIFDDPLQLRSFPVFSDSRGQYSYLS